MRRNEDSTYGRSPIDAMQMAVKSALKTARYDHCRTRLRMKIAEQDAA